MSAYRPGDITVDIAGVSTRLRLTLSSLAEMSETLGVQGPAELSAALRTGGAPAWRVVLTTVSTPRPEGMTEPELAALLPQLSALITTGFSI